MTRSAQGHARELSSIHLRESSIDVADGALEIWLRLVIAAIDDVARPTRMASEARQDWYEVATEEFGFGVIPELDALLTGEDRRSVVLDLCHAARRRLAELGDPISSECPSDCRPPPAPLVAGQPIQRPNTDQLLAIVQILDSQD